MLLFIGLFSMPVFGANAEITDSELLRAILLQKQEMKKEMLPELSFRIVNLAMDADR